MAMKQVRCKKCGAGHECGGRLSNEERARKAGLASAKKRAEKKKEPSTLDALTLRWAKTLLGPYVFPV